MRLVVFERSTVMVLFILFRSVPDMECRPVVQCDFGTVEAKSHLTFQ
jgi:hypothetical protein